MKKIAVLLACLTAAGVMAGTAAADSLVFVKNYNVWLANADGTGQYQVTLDGTSSSPYESPSQADDGTIVAIRQLPGERSKLWRMSQNGGLLNAPINTPAPGTGAINAKVSPDGRLVAYWFVTIVDDPGCPFCVTLASQALISYSDRFTGVADVGDPHTGAMPSWMSNDTILLSNGNATQWYFRIGMPEAAQWWADPDNNGGGLPVGLTDGEVSRDGNRIAVVRGDNNELIWVYKANGAPPAVPTATCAFTGATGGKFYSPTWSQDGLTLAWQEGDGIWSDSIPDVQNCGTYGTPTLRIPGGAEPDFGPAAVNPGARPGCGNPGNPAACPTPTISGSSPASPANNNSPKLKGTASEGSTVKLYSSTDCSGQPVATGSAATFASDGIGVSVVDNSTTTFRATATNSVGNVTACSLGYTYLEDSTAPTASLDDHPPKSSDSASAKFAFSANETATFKCKLDGDSFASCSSPKSYSGLSDGSHAFQVKPTDTAGNEGAAVSFSWSIATPKCVVPKVKGKRLAAAKAAIVKARCRTGKIRRAYSKRVRKGRVISQRPAPGARMAVGSSVRLVVSRGPRG
jgi:hypothetical protein